MGRVPERGFVLWRIIRAAMKFDSLLDREVLLHAPNLYQGEPLLVKLVGVETSG